MYSGADLAALAGGDDLDVVVGRELGLGAGLSRHEVAVECGRHGGLGVAPSGDELGQRRGRGLDHLSVDDDPDLLAHVTLHGDPGLTLPYLRPPTPSSRQKPGDSPRMNDVHYPAIIR